MSNELAPQDKVADEIERISADCLKLASSSANKMRLAFARANAIIKLREIMTPEIMAKYVLPLMGSKLGFGVDKEYPLEVVRDCAIEAIMRGVGLTGNHFMIIGGNCYIQQQGCRYLVLGCPGVTDVVVTPDIPKTVQSGMVVPVTATWNFNGKPMEMKRLGDQAFPVRLNAGQGADAGVGKAKRKMYAAIYELLTGNLETIPDVEEDELKSVQGTVVEEKSEEKPAAKPAQSAGEKAAAILKANQEAKPQTTEVTPAPTTVVPTPQPAAGKKSKKTAAAAETPAPAATAPAAATPAPASAPVTPATGTATSPTAAAAGASTPATKGREPIPTPKPEDIEEARFIPISPGGVKSIQDPVTKENVYRIRDDHSTLYTTYDLEKAKKARLAQEKREFVVLTYFKHKGDYIIVELVVEQAPVAPAAPQTGPDEEETELPAG